MRRFVCAVLIGLATAAWLTPSVWAQKKEKELTPLQQEEVTKKKDREVVDKQYERVMQNTTGASSTTKVDPWANMRAPGDKK